MSSAETTLRMRRVPDPVPVRRKPFKSGWLRPVTAGQVAVWEICALAVLVTVFPLEVPGMIAIGVTVLALALTTVRHGGLCLYQWIPVRLGHRRWVRAQRRVEPQPDPVRTVLPGLTVRRHVDRAGNRVGIATVDDDWMAVVRLPSGGHPEIDVLLTALRAAHDREDIPLAGAELVVWAAPAPISAAPGPVEPVRIHWLALRYRASDAPGAALARGGRSTGAERATASAAMGLVSRLAEAGQASSVLDEPELRQDLLVAMGADPRAFAGSTPGARPLVKVEESWRTWSIGRLTQACFAPSAGREATEVLGTLVPGSEFTCTSFTLRRTPRGTARTETTVRIGFNAKHAPKRLDHVVRKLAGDLVSLNGRHGQRVPSTLPLALP